MTQQQKSNWAAEGMDFLRRLLPVITGFAAVCALVWNFISPRAEDWVAEIVTSATAALKADTVSNTAAVQQLSRQIDTDNQTRTDMAQALAKIAATQNTMADTLSNAVDRLAALEESRKTDAAPVMQFMRYGSSISDGAPGGTVEVTWSFLKLREDCGRPRVNLYFRNGGGRVHRFVNVSALDENGRGPGGAPVQPNIAQSITYTMEIPDDDGVQPGRALGWNAVSWPDCPAVKPVTSPEVPFQILERNAR